MGWFCCKWDIFIMGFVFVFGDRKMYWNIECGCIWCCGMDLLDVCMWWGIWGLGFVML